ncbi:hypothetical protein [Aquimarina sp. 2304DJ70-9]|uniref:hypothetical protein n=1 Tax=Aquimarina penaris TaxID=3231044 RepID=UPI0034636F5A
MYLQSVEKVNVLFPLSMIAITVTNIFVYIDFVKYYDVIAFLITIYYLLSVFLLKRFIKKDDIRLHALISPQSIIGIVLIIYLILSISEIALPAINSSLIGVVVVLLSMLLFFVVSFFIYVSNRYEKSIYVFISACCALFVNALLGINELYYYSKVFTVLINIAEILSLYFFTRFFVETKLIDTKVSKGKYL